MSELASVPTSRVRQAAVTLAVCALVLTGSAGRAEAEGPAPAVTMTQNVDRVAVGIGERFGFTTTVHAPADSPLDGLIAHLNIVSLDPETYVDPEDWSDERTQYLPHVPAGGAFDLPWRVQAVNDGHFVVYVALAGVAAGAPVNAGPGLRAEVAAARTINAGGILPIAGAVPAAVLLVLLVARVRRSRHS